MNALALLRASVPDLRKGSILAVSNHALACCLLSVTGCLLYLIAYGSLQPMLAGLIYFAAGAALLRIIGPCPHESRMYRIMFSVGYAMSGMAAIYVNLWHDEHQLFSDAGNFFALSSGISQGLGLEDLKVISEGAGAIVLWRAIYDTFQALGFEKGRFIGVLVNVLCVALTGVFSVKIAKHLFPGDARRLERLIAIFPWAGIFWLFAAIHMRDAVALMGVTLLMYFWVRYLSRPSTLNFVLLAAATVSGFAYFGTLRTEFVFVPMAMLGTGMAAAGMYGKVRGIGKIVLTLVVLVGSALVLAYAFFLNSGLVEEIARNYQRYSEITAESGSSDSLGAMLIVNAPIPVRLVLGTIYLFVFPIPCWAGFQQDAIYKVFKSCNVLFNYAILPLFAMALLRIRRDKAVRTPSLMFLVFIFAGFTVAIAMTSLETRHFGAFQAPFPILALLPDLEEAKERATYRRMLGTFLALMAAVHLAWIGLKGL